MHASATGTIGTTIKPDLAGMAFAQSQPSSNIGVFLCIMKTYLDQQLMAQQAELVHSVTHTCPAKAHAGDTHSSKPWPLSLGALRAKTRPQSALRPLTQDVSSCCPTAHSRPCARNRPQGGPCSRLQHTLQHSDRLMVAALGPTITHASTCWDASIFWCCNTAPAATTAPTTTCRELGPCTREPRRLLKTHPAPALQDNTALSYLIWVEPCGTAQQAESNPATIESHQHPVKPVGWPTDTTNHIMVPYANQRDAVSNGSSKKLLHAQSHRPKQCASTAALQPQLVTTAGGPYERPMRPKTRCNKAMAHHVTQDKPRGTLPGTQQTFTIIPSRPTSLSMAQASDSFTHTT